MDESYGYCGKLSRANFGEVTSVLMLSRCLKTNHNIYLRPKGVSCVIEWLTCVIWNVGVSTFKYMPACLGIPVRLVLTFK